MRRHFILLALLLAAWAAVPARAGDEAPAWLQQAASVTPKITPADKDAPAVVLLDDQVVKVEDDGRTTTTTTYAIRILTREGRDYARAYAFYLTSSSKVKDIHAWLLRPSGAVKKYGKDETIDMVSDPDDIYDEYHVKTISGASDADTGAVFGFQTVVEEKPLFSHDYWLFQSSLPVVVSRYTMVLPVNWRVASKVFNKDKLEPTVNGSSYTWELRDLPGIPEEPYSPKFRSLAPRLAVKYFPPDGKTATGYSFNDWADVSRWVTSLHDSQVTLDDAVAAKARDLTANAKTELEKIQAIGRFVQDMQYISVDIGVGKGNGIRPRPANLVLARGYGDCKDKANLMRTLLKALKITAYPVAIYSGDANFVQSEWASPDQFNHCIIAIKVSDETQSPTVITHPALGRLLIFDATDDNTPVGDFPEEEQGSWALIVAGDQGSLARMPVLPPESSRLERNADVQLTPDGALAGKIEEKAVGQVAAIFRYELRRLPRPEYNQAIEGWVTHSVPGAKVSKVDPVDARHEGRFTLGVEFNANGYAKFMQNRLMIFKPAIISRLERRGFTNEPRRHPVVLDSEAFTETVRVKLPAGFDVDETPDPLKLETNFGSYTSKYEVKDGYLIFSRSLIQKAATIPADQYATVRDFFARIRAAEQNPVVLMRKQ